MTKERKPKLAKARAKSATVKPEASQPTPNAVPDQQRSDDAPAIFAQIALDPIYQAAATIRRYSTAMNGNSLDIEALTAELIKHVDAVTDGDLSRAEAMLFAQAHCLDAIFVNLAQFVAPSARQNLGVAETCLKLAFKAQNQCRNTLATLDAIKNPPTVYARQTNIAKGPQQVNNIAGAEGEPSRTRETKNNQNELSEVSNELLPYPTTSTLAGRTDPEMEAVGELNRSEDAAGKD